MFLISSIDAVSLITVSGTSLLNACREMQKILLEGRDPFILVCPSIFGTNKRHTPYFKWNAVYHHPFTIILTLLIDKYLSSEKIANTFGSGN